MRVHRAIKKFSTHEDEIGFLHGPDDLGENTCQRWILFFSLVNRRYATPCGHREAVVRDRRIPTTCNFHPLTKGASRNLSGVYREADYEFFFSFTYEYLSEHFTLFPAVTNT